MEAQDEKATNSGPEMKADLDRLVGLVEASRVDEARELSQQLAQKWPDSQPIQRLFNVLQPPRATFVPGLPVRSFREEYAWIDDHAHEYPGCWLAIYQDRLVASGPDRKEVVRTALAELGEDRPLLFFQPADAK
jgi:hypothetical protein